MRAEKEQKTAASGSALGVDSLAFAESAHPHILVLLEAWLNARQGQLVPLRDELTPDKIVPVLPHIWIYRYEDDVGDFVCRLAGERINNAWGKSLRGVSLGEVVGPAGHAAALRRWRAILNTPCIQYGKVMGTKPDDDKIMAERLVLPLADQNGAVSFTIGLSVYPYRQDDRNRTPPVWGDVTVVPCADLC